MIVIRRLGAAVLAAAAIAVWFAMAPSDSPSSKLDYSGEIAAALADYATNNASASSAPQQQVVNGWVARDLLTVLARQQDAALSPKSAPHDDRIPAELLLGVLGIALMAGTGPGPLGSRTAAHVIPFHPTSLNDGTTTSAASTGSEALSQGENYLKQLYERGLRDSDVEHELERARVTGVLTDEEYGEARALHAQM